MPSSSASGVPAPRRPAWRLALLTTAVLAAHWAVLRSTPLALAVHDKGENTTTWAFASRTIVAPTAPPPAPVAVGANPARAARNRALRQPPSNRTPPQTIEENRPLARVDIDTNAPEIIAIHPSPSAPTDSAPTQQATATPPENASDGAVEASASPPPPLPVKAVRTYVIPPPARLRYAVTGEVKGFPYYVNAELAWTQDGKTYDARMEISHFLLGSRVQTSTGQISGQGLEPTRFGDKVKSEVAAHFEREKGKVSFSANTPDTPLLAGAQDQLSIFMQMAAMLAGDPRGFPEGSTLSFQAVGPRSADTWVFTVGSADKQSLAGGELEAVHLWRNPSGEYDPKTEVWLAPALGYLPVRIRLTQRNGDFVDQQWKSTQP